MAETQRTKLSVEAERVLLVAVILPGSPADPADPLGELRSLARTAGATVVDEMVVKRAKLHPGHYVGSGKARQIGARAAQNAADTVIFDNDLTPAQIRDLEAVTARKVVDRSELILDIFAAHARTSESRLQVELAQLEYTYPRLRHMWTHLERVAGGATTPAAAVGGIGTRGPGEKQIEIDRRLVRRRVVWLKRKIAEIDRRKVRQVRARGRGALCVCLVGYTNAGKSTLMNRLTGAGAYVADKLFATLDTKTRRWKLGGAEVLLSDTVGFIRDLPHHLVASFRATLEEAIGADMLIHVADASHEHVAREIAAVEAVLDELGCDRTRCLLALNKIDRITDPTVPAVLAHKFPGGMLISAATGEGVGALSAAVADRADSPAVSVRLTADCRNGRLMQYIARHATVEKQTFRNTTARIDAVIPVCRLAGLSRFGDDVRIVRRRAAGGAPR